MLTFNMKELMLRYGCDNSYNDRSNRAQHERKTHGIDEYSQTNVKIDNSHCYSDITLANAEMYKESE